VRPWRRCGRWWKGSGYRILPLLGGPVLSASFGGFAMMWGKRPGVGTRGSCARDGSISDEPLVALDPWLRKRSSRPPIRRWGRASSAFAGYFRSCRGERGMSPNRWKPSPPTKSGRACRFVFRPPVLYDRASHWACRKSAGVEVQRGICEPVCWEVSDGGKAQGI
jgi:hypothetical protein